MFVYFSIFSCDSKTFASTFQENIDLYLINCVIIHSLLIRYNLFVQETFLEDFLEVLGSEFLEICREMFLC